jgi:carbamoyltransferase
MRVLGVSAYYHDSAAALLVDGRIVAAAQEERFSRLKHDARFPEQAIRFCLEQARLAPAEIDYVAFYDKPLLKFERLVETYLAYAPRGYRSFATAIPLWVRDKLFQRDLLTAGLRRVGFERKLGDRLLFAEHHQSHAASAFYPSPFSEAVVLTMDGVGEWATTSVAIGAGRSLEMVRELRFPHSLGLLYSAFTSYGGFKVNSGEYKLMGLAPYGTPRFASLILEKLIDVKEDGSFRLDLDYFDFCTGFRMTNDRFERLFGQGARAPTDPIEPFHMDVAASIQAVTDQVVLRLTRSLAAEFRLENLCLAGGVALNCVSNGKVLRDGAFRRIWVQPAAGDAGGAVGAALAAEHLHAGSSRVPPEGLDGMSGAFLGPSFAQAQIEARLHGAGARFEVAADESELIDTAVAALVGQQAVGWFQGRMEFGPRALGARSILGDARSPAMQRVLNLKVKFRESFRPFAPSVLRERVAAWFDLEVDSPYMLLVAGVRPERRCAVDEADQRLAGLERINTARSQIPAATHVDYSARIQTVHRETNPLFHRLLSGFEERTGCPVLVNTSFNVRGEPIVCTPEDAFRCFLGTGLDLLLAGRCVVRKDHQERIAGFDHRNAFEPD